MIGIINYKAGNAPSVFNALQKLNVKSKLISNANEFEDISGIILLGVGSAKATMESIESMGIREVIENMVVNRKKPFMGICIGLQVLFDFSEEGDTKCLGWIKGKVKRFDENKVRVPQIGWNETEFVFEHPLAAGLNKKEFFYFVNSYHAIPEDKSMILAKTDYGSDFCSMIACGNIFATQFHAEKSGVTGLKLLKNFAAIAGV